MAYTYRIYNQHGCYFITCTVHQWVDVFTRKEYVDILLDSLRYCQVHKGLLIYGYVIMTNHIHLIIGSSDQKLSDVIRDFKKFTATKIVNAVKSNPRESRKNWLLWLLQKDDAIWFWEEGYHGIEIVGTDFFRTKLNYIHLNPVRTGIVSREEDYRYSSCADYYGTGKGPLDIVII